MLQLPLNCSLSILVQVVTMTATKFYRMQVTVCRRVSDSSLVVVLTSQLTFVVSSLLFMSRWTVILCVLQSEASTCHRPTLTVEPKSQRHRPIPGVISNCWWWCTTITPGTVAVGVVVVGTRTAAAWWYTYNMYIHVV